MGDALGVQLEGLDLIPQPCRHRCVGQLELGRCQLAHQQKHQLLFFAFGKRAGKSAPFCRRHHS